MEIQDQDGMLQAIEQSITSENLSALVSLLQLRPEKLHFEIPTKQLSAIFTLTTSSLASDPPLLQGDDVLKLINALQLFENAIIPIKLYEAVLALQEEPIAYRLRQQLFLEIENIDRMEESISQGMLRFLCTTMTYCSMKLLLGYDDLGRQLYQSLFTLFAGSRRKTQKLVDYCLDILLSVIYEAEVGQDHWHYDLGQRLCKSVPIWIWNLGTRDEPSVLGRIDLILKACIQYVKQNPGCLNNRYVVGKGLGVLASRTKDSGFFNVMKVIETTYREIMCVFHSSRKDNGDDRAYRQAAFDFATAFFNPAVVLDLVRNVLKGDGKVEIRIHAMHVLRDSPALLSLAEEVAVILQDVLNSDPAPSVRRAALELILTKGWDSFAGRPAAKVVVAKLIEVSPKVSNLALQLIKSSGGMNIIAPFFTRQDFMENFELLLSRASSLMEKGSSSPILSCFSSLLFHFLFLEWEASADLIDALSHEETERRLCELNIFQGKDIEEDYARWTLVSMLLDKIFLTAQCQEEEPVEEEEEEKLVEDEEKEGVVFEKKQESRAQSKRDRRSNKRGKAPTADEGVQGGFSEKTEDKEDEEENKEDEEDEECARKSDEPADKEVKEASSDKQEDAMDVMNSESEMVENDGGDDSDWEPRPKKKKPFIKRKTVGSQIETLGRPRKSKRRLKALLSDDDSDLDMSIFNT